MKKRVLLLVLTVVALLFVLTSCHKHSYEQSEVIKEATCDAAGQAKFVCSCGEEETRDVPAKGHTWGEAQVVEPSCYKDGYTYKTCAVCEAESEHTDIVPKSDEYHNYEEIFTTEPDCSNLQHGLKEWVCSYCKQKDPSQAAQRVEYNHDYEVIETPATCEAPGSIVETCKVCGAPGRNEVIPQLEHTPVKVADREADCDNPARVEYQCSVCEHVWAEGEGEGLGHDWEEKTQAPTCTTPGYDYKECKRCHAKENLPGTTEEATGHTVDYNDPTKVERNEPTCITSGSIIPICTVCGEKLTSGTDKFGTPYVKEISATGVHFVEKEKIDEKTATCHEAAYIEYKCTCDANCVETNKEHSGSPVPHNHVFIKTVEPTCISEGYDLYVCSLCELDTTENSECELGCVEHRNVQPMDDHDPGFQTKVNATCYANAYEIHICPICEREYTVELPNEGENARPEHDFSIRLEDQVIPATCTSEGHTVYKCANDGCQETTHKEITRRTAHAFEVFNDGRYVCTACSITYRDISTYIDKAIDEGYMPVSKVQDVTLNASTLEYVFTATEAGAYTIIVNSVLGENVTVELKVWDAATSAWVVAEGAELAEGDQIKVVATGIGAESVSVSVCKALLWELKGYGNPAEIESIVANQATVIFEANGSSNMSKGVIKLISDNADVEYTILVELENGETMTYTNEHLVDSIDNAAAGKYLDLYDSNKVVKITVTSTAGASYIICANEG